MDKRERKIKYHTGNEPGESGGEVISHPTPTQPPTIRLWQVPVSGYHLVEAASAEEAAKQCETLYSVAGALWGSDAPKELCPKCYRLLTGCICPKE